MGINYDELFDVHNGFKRIIEASENEENVTIEMSRDDLIDVYKMLGRYYSVEPYLEHYIDPIKNETYVMVKCGECLRYLGKWTHRRIFDDGKDKFIAENKFCKCCGRKIDWGEIE